MLLKQPFSCFNNKNKNHLKTKLLATSYFYIVGVYAHIFLFFEEP